MRQNESAKQADRLVDDIDLALLHALQADARAPIGTLSDAAGVSRATAYVRLARLRDERVIKDLTVSVDAKAVGLPVTAVVLLRSTPDTWNVWSSLVPLFEDMPEVELALDIAGEFDLLLLVRVRDTDHLETFINKDLRRVPGIGGTRTLLVLNQSPQRSLILPPRRVPSGTSTQG